MLTVVMARLFCKYRNYSLNSAAEGKNLVVLLLLIQEARDTAAKPSIGQIQMSHQDAKYA